MSVDLNDLARRVQAMEDLAAITDVKVRYLRACDRKQPAEVRKCFTDDATIDFEGFPVFDNADDFGRGDRVLVRLPVIGRIEAYCMWTRGTRAGFQFERLLRLDDFSAMIGQVQPNPKLRRPR